jgi:hypothetical protein
MLSGNCHCGAVTIDLPSMPGARHGVNLRNFDPDILASLRIRHFDGADTWQFLDVE